MRRSLPAVALVAALALAGCASSQSPASSSSPAPSASASAEGVTVSNCGFDATFETPPERVVTIKSTTTEALIALGLGDRIVGTAFQDGPLPDSLTVDEPLPVIDERMPGAESVLELEPDLIFSGWESAFAADAVGTRDELADLGVGTYVWPTACMSADAPTEVTFDDIAAEVEQLADIFDVDASGVVADQQEMLDGITADDRGLSALWWSSGTETPYVGAGQGAPELILETAGLTNVASDLEGGWSPYGWESVLAADPDVIVIVDSAWNTADHKIDYLESDPTLSQLTAVQQHRYVIVPFAASEAGVRTAEAAASVALQVSEIAL
ncbi:putative F420-0 ABC transporter substrate-binding protein [Agrococcus sp. SGAir0287]|uniref:putative F420-0 ABC transporter substrate-binding protein n=1 Tax=Agrococcus sp. SGAir0287 TaxID=2070347 RepID=UPI0010CCD0AB|nr:putative F420-0 ABC transporter substrate-binding protein [Agrococcus sp. SGAir0287]QCR19757.1 putative F420-0 ABC transporter substrate-binding protein [Agrococcus sp. SGAir0287]